METCTMPVVEEVVFQNEDTAPSASWGVSTAREAWTTLTAGDTFTETRSDFDAEMARWSSSLCATFEISPQQLGYWSFDGNTSYSHFWQPTPHYEVDTALAQRQFRALLEAYPRAIPVIKAAIHKGRIDGGTYGSRYSCTMSRCLVGWVGTVYRHTESIRGILTGPYAMLERYVRNIVPGQTPETSPILATLFSLLEQVEEEQRSVEEVYSLTTQVLDEYPLVCPYYLRAAEEGRFTMYSYTLTPDGRTCVVGWVAISCDWENRYAVLSDTEETYISQLIEWRGDTTQLRQLECALMGKVTDGETATTNAYIAALRQACLDYKNTRQALTVVPERTLARCHS